MKLSTLAVSITLTLLAAAAAQSADVAPTNQVADGIAKLKSATNYSWTATVVIPDSNFTPGPLKGQAGKDGYAKMSQSFNDNLTEVVLKGDKVAYKSEDGWTVIGDGGDMGAFFAGNIARNGAAAQEAEIALKDVKDLKLMVGGVLGGDFTTEGATDFMTFGPRRSVGAANGGFTPPAPKNAKGSVKFWIKDGVLTKYETHLHGTVTFGGNENEMDLTRTVEISDVGATKMDIPTDAKSKLDGK